MQVSLPSSILLFIRPLFGNSGYHHRSEFQWEVPGIEHHLLAFFIASVLLATFSVVGRAGQLGSMDSRLYEFSNVKYSNDLSGASLKLVDLARSTSAGSVDEFLLRLDLV